MKRKALKKSYRKGAKSKMKGTLGMHLQVKLGQVSANASSSAPLPHPFLQNLLDSGSSEPQPFAMALDFDADADGDEKDFILSQDFFCTPDYITPDNQNLQNGLDCNKENIPCPKSPEKLNTLKNKRCPQDGISMKPLSPILYCHQQVMELEQDTLDSDEVKVEKTAENKKKRSQNYVSQSAVALRCRVMPPPCIKNPYLKDGSEMDVDPFGNQRSKCSGFFSAIMGGEGLSRYHTDFHEIEQIGVGNFSRVFKVLKRIDGCLYAVKHTTRQLHQDTDRRKAFMEVQALAALGSHENIVTYYSSWFENEQLYIQLELCDHSLSKKPAQICTEAEVLVVVHQIAKALEFMHEKGIAHLDVKPDNVYVKAELLLDLKLNSIISSPTNACVETATVISRMQEAADCLGADCVPRYVDTKQMGALDIEDIFRQSKKDAVENLEAGWLNRFEDEIISKLWNQSGKAWESVLTELSDESEPQKVVVVIGHPAIHTALTAHCLNLTKEWIGSFHVDAGSISIIDFPDGATGRGVVRCINYTAHLGRWSIPITRPTPNDEDF